MSTAMSVSCPQLIHRGQAALVSKEIANLLLYNSFRVARSFVATLLKPWQLGIRRGGFRCAQFCPPLSVVAQPSIQSLIARTTPWRPRDPQHSIGSRSAEAEGSCYQITFRIHSNEFETPIHSTSAVFQGRATDPPVACFGTFS